MTDIVLRTPVDHRWGANRIELVGAEARRFPGENFAHWTDLRGGSAKASALLAQADLELHAVEHDEHLSGAGRAAKAKETVRQHLPKLAELDNRPSSVLRRMEFLEAKAAKKMKEAATPF